MAAQATESDTIAAIATPLGSGGLGVIRLSGPRAFKIAGSLFRPSPGRAGNPLQDAPTHTLHHGFLIASTGEALDEVVVGLFRTPRSYTGEDVVEISCHGGPAILSEALEACRAAGARLAEPGEFTKRAYLNGRLDLSQAEAVAELIASRSAGARRAALHQLNGGLSRSLRPFREALTELLAALEANLDFVEEDIPPLPAGELAGRLRGLREDLERFLGSARAGRLQREGARVVIVGKPNAGKSSLFNRLVHFDRSIVTEVPGTTRDTLEETVSVDGFGLVLVDTAGWREAVDPVEKIGVERTRSALESADGVLFVLDGSRPLEEEDRRLAEHVTGKPGVAVLNKTDLPLRLAEEEAGVLLRGLGGDAWPFAAVSSRTGDGLENLRRRLPEVFGGPSKEAPETLAVANARHLGLLEQALGAVDDAREAVSRGESEECIALELRRGLEALGEITGENVGEDVLDEIFLRFCIGK